MYKIEKTQVKNGKTSDVRVGAYGCSKQIKVVRVVAPHEIIKGDEVYVGSDWTNYVKTSPVVNIIKNDDGSLSVETQTSMYLLREEE